MTDEGHTVNFDKAFDSANHRFLLAKMKSFGLGDVIVRWIEAYLFGRVSSVNDGGDLSRTIPMRSGISQGSVIGPLLFLLFVNDLLDALNALTLLFADEVKMVTPRTQDMNLHSCLTAALNWSQKWHLSINPVEYTFLTIGRKVL